MKRLLGAGIAAGLAVAGLAVTAPAADATINVGAINCTSSTLLGPIAIRQPSVSHVTGPVWADTGTSVTITNEGGLTILPRNVGPAVIGSFQDLVNKSQVVGTATTTMTPGAIPGLVFLFDPDLADNGGVPNPVPMNGVATYVHALDGVLGPFPAPTVVVAGPLPLVGTAGTYDVTSTLDPGAGTLPVGSTPGNPGAGIFTPDVPLVITSTGTTDGQINTVATSTATTANVTAPIVTAAVTTCGPSATPTHTVNIQTDNGPIVAASPVIACDPTNGTGGVFKDSKGWWSQDTNPATPENNAGSLGGSTTFDGCRAPDARLLAWNTSKNGALPADSIGLARAQISVKGKSYGNCTLVDEVNQAGRVHAANDPIAYEQQGTLATKYQTGATPPATSKVKGATVYGGIRLVIDTSGGAAAMRFEMDGIVTKGVGLGGNAYWLAEVSLADPAAQTILACNQPGYVPPANGTFPAKVAPYVNLSTGDDAVFSISAP